MLDTINARDVCRKLLPLGLWSVGHICEASNLPVVIIIYDHFFEFEKNKIKIHDSQTYLFGLSLFVSLNVVDRCVPIA